MIGWLAALPLLLLPACWLWWWAGGLNPGVQPGRSAVLLIAVLAALAALPSVTAQWRRPAVLLLVAGLAWQAVALAWAPVQEPGWLWLGERAGALAATVALTAWLSRIGPDAALGWPLACAATGILGLTALTQTPWWELLRAGREAPFGNANFAVGAALPLLVVACVWSGVRGGRTAILCAAAGLLAAGLLATGLLGGDPCRAVWLGLAAGTATALILRLPARWHLPLLAAGALALVAGLAAAVAGSIDPAALGAGSSYRVHVWRAAGEAVAGPAMLGGYGPGSAIAVLAAQPSAAAAFLTVPSYAEHAHNEALQVLLDGGLPLAGLLVAALWFTIAPLWRRRGEPAAAALLAGWACALALALVESHLSQPGPLLCLALLAGLSWALIPPQAELRASSQRWLGPLAAAALTLLLLRELAGDGGGPTSIEVRADRRLPEDAAGRLQAIDALAARLGELPGLGLQRAKALGRLGRHDEAQQALADQLDLLPCLPGALELAARLRRAGRAGPDLLAAEARARQRATGLLARIAENPVNRELRLALAAALADGDPAPVP